jgi:multisubunit Na+/H+ antiporter MnhF subunit
MNSLQYSDIVGIVGASLLLVAYFMATTKRWQTHTLQYQLSNLVAAILLIYYSFTKTAYVHVVINIVWASVAVVGLVLIEKHRKKWPNRPKK